MGIIKIAKLNRDNRFIKGDPLVNQIPIGLETKTRIFLVSIGGFFIFPTIPLLLKSHRQIKMIEVDQEVNPFFLYLFKDTAVEINACLVDLPSSFWENAGPLDRGPKGGVAGF